MAVYNADQRLPLSELVRDARNRIVLRRDLAGAFEEGVFVIVPKVSPLPPLPPLKPRADRARRVRRWFM